MDWGFSKTKNRSVTCAAALLTLGLIVAAPAEGGAKQPPSPADCGALTADFAKIGKNKTTVGSAIWMPEAAPTPAHCLVEGFVTTGNKKQGFNQVNFRAWLPVPWNGKFHMQGGGGFVGNLPAASAALLRGYADIGTDTGHQASGIDASWAQDSPTKVIDFGYRGVHVTAVAGKQLVKAFYGEKPEYSYFQGCSRGGGQAFMEAQRFPKDFDGIVAGAPAHNWSAFMAGFADTQQNMYPDPANVTTPVLPIAKLPLLESRVDANCDAVDGIADGIIDDPRQCTFNADSDIPICAAGDEANPNCLTAQELEAAKAVYNGPANAQGQIYAGFPVGGESVGTNWDLWIVGFPDLFGPGLPNLHFAFSDSFFRYMAYEDNDDGSFGLHDFDLEEFATLEPIGKILNATDPELKKFRKDGRKLIVWTGWADAAITALGTIDYFEAVIDTVGERETNEFARLYLAPGMSHCAGGEGPSEFDMLSALEDWVERDVPPAEIIAVHRDATGQVDIERPLCPYPQVARLIDPAGSTVEASNFECVAPFD